MFNTNKAEKNRHRVVFIHVLFHNVPVYVSLSLLCYPVQSPLASKVSLNLIQHAITFSNSVYLKGCRFSGVTAVPGTAVLIDSRDAFDPSLRVDFMESLPSSHGRRRKTLHVDCGFHFLRLTP